MTAAARACVAGAFIGAIVTLPGLGNGTLWDNSETAYGEVAREILLRGDWIVLHFNAANWFVQPPLYFWLAAICAKIFGVGSFAMRLPSALATIAMGALTAYAVARQAGARAGIYASAILSTCLMQAIVGRLAIMDALLDLAVAFTIFWWFRAAQTGIARYFLYGCAAAAIGFLAKGPVAPVVSLLVIVPYWIWEARASGVRPPTWKAVAAGLLLFVLITAPWFVALAARAGSPALQQLIGHYTVGRYLGTIENQSGPFWYYIPVLILGFFPWIAFIPSATAYCASVLGRNAGAVELPKAQILRLAACWALLPLIFFSFARTKLPNYIALEFPALALLVALYFDDLVQRARRRSAIISAAAVPLTIVLVAFAAVWFARDNRLLGELRVTAIDFILLAAAIFIGALVALFLLARRQAASAPYALAIAMMLAINFLTMGLPQVERFKPIPHLAQAIQAGRRPGDVVAIEGVAGGNALVFYTRPVVYVLAQPDGNGRAEGADPRSVVCRGRVWLVAPARPSARSYGRSLHALMRWQKDELYLYDGPPCAPKKTG